MKEEIKRSSILALDIATKTGYYNTNDGGGVWNFTPTLSRNNRKSYKAFRDTLVRFIKVNDIKIVIAEDVNVKGHFVAMRKLSEFRGILQEVCESLDIKVYFVNVRSIKFNLTKNGNASKELMVKTVKNKFNIEPIDDNHADAIAIFYYFVKNINKYIKSKK